VERDHASMIQHYLDADFGKILEELHRQGLDNNTLIIFASDNGAHNEGGHSYLFFNSSGQFRGFKRSLYEGGSRSATIMVWPEHISPNSEAKVETAFWDFMPTFAELAGVPSPNYTDGISLVPVLTGRKERVEKMRREDLNGTHGFLYFEFCTNETFGQAVRAGEWKLVRFALEQAWQLYNLEKDIGEKDDVAEQHPDLVKALAKIVEEQHVNNPAFPVDPCISSLIN